VSEPTFAPRLNTGDPNDDDGPVIDSLLIEVDNPPEPLPDASVDPQRSEVRPRKTGRLLTLTHTLLPGWDPVQVGWADPDRKTFRIQVVGTTTTDFVRFADDASKLSSDTTCARVYASAAGTRIDLDNHTGPIWVKPDADNDAAGVVFSVWNVTE
jgi:hypothetical protein